MANARTDRAMLLKVNSFVAPTSNTTNAVTEWLSANDVSSTPLTPAGDWLGISVIIDQANRLLDADFGIFKQT